MFSKMLVGGQENQINQSKNKGRPVWPPLLFKSHGTYVRVCLRQLVHRHAITWILDDVDFNHAASVGKQRTAFGTEVFEA